MTERSELEQGGQVVQRQASSVEYVMSYEDVEGISLSPVSLLNTILRHRHRIVIWTISTGALAVLLTIALRTYEAESSFAPQSQQSSPSSLAGLASQFGFNLAALSSGPSLDFYAAVANSRATLTAAVNSQYRVVADGSATDSASGTLVQLLRVRGATPQERIQRAVKKLDHMVTVAKDEDAGIVTVKVKAKNAALAEAVNRRLLELVNDVSLSQHQAQASAEGAFVVGRLQEVRAQLDTAEDALRTFSEQNRTFQDSPRLSVEEGRLQRRVDFLQQVYLTLAQSYERARIEEARNTPVITVIDAPEASARKVGSVVLSLAVGLAFGCGIGLLLGIAGDYMNSQRSAESPAYREFTSLRAAVLRELTALPRGIVATFRRGRNG